MVAEAFALAVGYDGPRSVFNISSGVGTTLIEVIDMIERITGAPMQKNFKPGRPFDVPVSVLDNALARDELGWTPKVGLNEGMRRTADYMRKAIAG